jgi:hypothetical protein
VAENYRQTIWGYAFRYCPEAAKLPQVRVEFMLNCSTSTAGVSSALEKQKISAVG